MAVNGRKNVDTALLLALSRGLTVRTAAKKAGCGERTVYRRMKDADFQDALKHAKEKLIGATADRLSGLGTKAVKRLNKLLGDGVDPKVQLGACKAALEIALKLREQRDLAERLEAIEAQQQQQQDKGKQR